MPLQHSSRNPVDELTGGSSYTHIRPPQEVTAPLGPWLAWVPARPLGHCAISRLVEYLPQAHECGGPTMARSRGPPLENVSAIVSPFTRQFI